ncbi:hypothetical protein QYE76_042222 [Lolium multiflorum]|uniref:Reverse transcriptase domain-containing protein n=1 Tax=Lolium multiflorum TaxID=4521 RepID=A0AAD8TGI6_LOLMU|nr:hypothetical protein QYE76_042222 [Lolium multiflorum]
MNAVLAPFLRKFALVFFDDILIYSRTYEEHLGHLHSVLTVLDKEKWQVKLSKCAFAQNSMAYLGHVISADGVATDNSKIVSIQTWPRPTTVKELRGFLGITRYYRKFIRQYAVIAQPLTQLLKKGSLFIWTDSTEMVFQTLKTALVTAPVLALPNFDLPFTVETDACDIGIGVVLSQQGHPVAFQAKPERTLPAGLLQPLPIPSEPWEMAMMDFIHGLPQSRQFNCILVVVDKLSKYFPIYHHLMLCCRFLSVYCNDEFVNKVSEQSYKFSSNGAVHRRKWLPGRIKNRCSSSFPVHLLGDKQDFKGGGGKSCVGGWVDRLYPRSA